VHAEDAQRFWREGFFAHLSQPCRTYPCFAIPFSARDGVREPCPERIKSPAYRATACSI
jgi:hypothetical protein